MKKQKEKEKQKVSNNLERPARLLSIDVTGNRDSFLIADKIIDEDVMSSIEHVIQEKFIKSNVGRVSKNQAMIQM